jgi:hypothetical protein
MKLTEETGEVTQAVIGAMGQNPCKGVTHTRDEMLPLASRNPNLGLSPEISRANDLK